ncbi:type III secretion system needle protein [Tabrizicola sp. TH137]|uniref:EscF/YscF/HrpA family type III secretion system needle major subunit n=1 Tax=Tabrizicola sp. TH137 TaxID=2067452 RepID=UPI000C7B6D5E|nr:EscF/YscF/HrpA family type III secretion system needle major subunit [Tabrizicola sp. TH137]PLL11199.1 type III secretion system needle protein [Tabrizicola sp. TH137]
MTTTANFINLTGNAAPGSGLATNPVAYSRTSYETYDGFDLIWRQEYLQTQIREIENDIREIELNANLSDTEKMYAMQMAMNTWSAVTNLRTNIMKSVSDTLKAIVRNVA